MQIILFLETRSSCKSDYKYIKATIDYFYNSRTFGIKPIYAKCKSELIKQDKKIIEITKKIKTNDQFNVVVCADFDNANDPDNSKIFSYCKKHGYDLVWMNVNVEDVYLKNDSVKDKDDSAHDFLRKSDDFFKTASNLSINNPINQKSSSNILIVLDKYLSRK